MSKLKWIWRRFELLLSIITYVLALISFLNNNAETGMFYAVIGLIGLEAQRITYLKEKINKMEEQ